MAFRWQLAQFFEIRWWRRYLRNKDHGVYTAWKKAYWRDFLAKTGLEVPLNARVLDAGCGPAGIFMMFNKQQVDALDPLLGLYERQLPHFRRSDYPNVRFFESRLEAFETKTIYDLVFCVNAINHVADLDLCLDRLVALVAPGGKIVMSVDAHNYPCLKRLFRFFPADILHPHQYGLKEYEALLVERGCKIERVLSLKKELIFTYYLLVAGV